MGTKLATLLWIALAVLSLGCDNDEADVTAQPYGGEVMIFHVRLPDGGDQVRLSAHFIAAQDPDLAPADVPLGQCGPDQGSVQGDRRQYIDVGESVTFHLGDVDFVVPRLVADPDSAECVPGTACAEGVVDFSGRTHEVAYLSDVSPGPEAGDGILVGEASVTTAEPQSFSDQLRVLQPPIMQVESPTLDAEARFMDFRQAEDVVLDWQHSEPADDLTINITFLPAGATTATTCRVPDTGSFTVPHDVIDGLEADSGQVAVYSVSRATVATDEGRAIDVRAEYHGNFFSWQRSTGTYPGQ